MRNTSKIKRDWRGRWAKGTAKPKGSGMKKGTQLKVSQEKLPITYSWTDQLIAEYLVEDLTEKLQQQEIISQSRQVTIGKLEQEVKEEHDFQRWTFLGGTVFGSIIGVLTTLLV